MQTIRFCLDKILRASIRLAMLTGVAFTVTACYGVVPRDWEDPAYQADTQQVEQQLTIDEEILTE